MITSPSQETLLLSRDPLEGSRLDESERIIHATRQQEPNALVVPTASAPRPDRIDDSRVMTLREMAAGTCPAYYERRPAPPERAPPSPDDDRAWYRQTAVSPAPGQHAARRDAVPGRSSREMHPLLAIQSPRSFPPDGARGKGSRRC